MKRILSILLSFVALTGLLRACNCAPAGQDLSDLISSIDLSHASLQGGLQQVGAEGLGYLQLPESWQEEITAGGSIAWMAPDGQGYVTLQASDSLIAPEDWAAAIKDMYTQMGYKPVSQQASSFSGFECQMVTAQDSIYDNLYSVSWVFNTDDSRVHCVSLDAPLGYSESLIQLVKAGFSA